MKIYLWHEESQVSENWHDGGAVVIVTGREYNDVWADYASNPMWRGKLRNALPEPDLQYAVDDSAEEAIFVYEDAGCC